jgi:predicted oxidoreductase
MSRILALVLVVLCLAQITLASPSFEARLLANEPAAAHDPVPEAELMNNEQETALLGVESLKGPTGRRPTIPAHKQPKDKLDIALAAIKQDIMVQNRQLQEEAAWVAEVNKITETYTRKVKRVEVDMKKTRENVKALFRKKKQIENLKIQRQLEAKLKDAQTDLSTLQQALHHVKSKAKEFDKTKQEIKKTIYGIHTQLAKLKGEKPKPPAQEN